MSQYFLELSPEKVLDAAEEEGFACSGRCFALNSYENRVYEIELEGTEGPTIGRRRVIKFYRPGRWTEAQILEEHEFLNDLKEAEIPVVAPEPFKDGKTLHKTAEGLWYTIFPKVGGRIPDELNDEQLLMLGRLLGRIHSVGASKKANHRIHLTPETYAGNNLDYLLEKNWIHQDVRDRYSDTVREIIELALPQFKNLNVHRIHGDCHLGNLLWDKQGPFFLDFDDMLTGPAVQDFWLLFPTQGNEGTAAMDVFLEGYELMFSFDRSTLKLIEILRALRFVHYTAWLARRWEDPAFPRAFPHFNTLQYWTQATRDLEDQLVLIRTILSNTLKFQ